MTTRIRIMHDECAESPREWDNLGTMVCAHRRYSLGDEGARAPELSDIDEATVIECFTREAEHVARQEAEDYADKYQCGLYEAILDLYDDPSEYPYWAWQAIEWGHEILSLYLYDHSGITMNVGGFSCPWDSGHVGIVFASHDRIREEYGSLTPDTIGKAREVMKAEVGEYAAYLEGRVYGFTVESDDGAADDSCWGFIVDWNDDQLGGMVGHLPESLHDAARRAFDNIGEWVEMEPTEQAA